MRLYLENVYGDPVIPRHKRQVHDTCPEEWRRCYWSWGRGIWSVEKRVCLQNYWKWWRMHHISMTSQRQNNRQWKQYKSYIICNRVRRKAILSHSPTCWKGLCWICCMIASNGLCLNSLDVKSAFIKGKLIKRVVYMPLPKSKPIKYSN